jgi:hypothetical protein
VAAAVPVRVRCSVVLEAVNTQLFIAYPAVLAVTASRIVVDHDTVADLDPVYVGTEGLYYTARLVTGGIRFRELCELFLGLPQRHQIAAADT